MQEISHHELFLLTMFPQFLSTHAKLKQPTTVLQHTQVLQWGGGVPLSILSILSLSFFSFFCTGQCFGDKMDNTRDKRDKNFGQMRQKIRQAQM